MNQSFFLNAKCDFFFFKESRKATVLRRKREEFYLLFIAQKIGTLSEREGVISIRSLHLLERERYERKERKKREVFSCFCVRVCVFVVLPPTFERDERRSVRDYHILVRRLSGELD
jgi:hypothetical protein